MNSHCNFGEEGECDFISCYAIGCTNPIACNFDSEAEILDASCVFATGCDYCSGEQDGTGTVVDGDADGNGICDGLENWVAQMWMLVISMVLPKMMEAVNLQKRVTTVMDRVNDADGDGVCDADEIDGCNDVNACNYNENATENDGTCDYCSCSDAGTDGYGLEVELVTEHTEGELAGMSTYRLYVTTPHNDDFLSAAFGDEEEPLNVGTTTSFYQHIYGSVLGSDMIPDIYPNFPELEYDSWVTIGLDQGAGPGEFVPQVIQSTEFSWVDQFEAGGDIDIDDSVGGSWFALDPNATDNAYSGDDQKILIMQLTTDGIPCRYSASSVV